MKNEWWKQFYDEHLAHMLLHPATGEDSTRTCDFLTEILQLSPGDRIFDQCCGTGRLGIEFAKRGFQVIGIDLAEGYIHEAQALKQENSEFHAADAFLFTTDEPCHAVVNWWTSFGYSSDDQENGQMLARANESLVPGGIFAMDYMNTPNLYRNFKPLVTTTQVHEGETTTLHRRSAIDFAAGRLLKKWEYHLPTGETVEHDTATQLYSPNQLVRFFEEYGFVEIKLFGDIDGSDLALESPRCIIVGRKPH